MTLKKTCECASDLSSARPQKPDMMCAQTIFPEAAKVEVANLVLPLATSTRTYLNVIYHLHLLLKTTYKHFTLT